MKRCPPEATMREYGVCVTLEKLDDAAEALQRALQAPDEEAVHKARVSIRRLQQSLRLFRQFFRDSGVQQIRREMKSIMTPAGEVRNHDIAAGLVKGVWRPTAAFRQEREQARSELQDALRAVVQSDLAERWRKVLLKTEAA